jgi:hypothetical protein
MVEHLVERCRAVVAGRMADEEKIAAAVPQGSPMRSMRWRR